MAIATVLGEIRPTLRIDYIGLALEEKKGVEGTPRR